MISSAVVGKVFHLMVVCEMVVELFTFFPKDRATAGLID